MVIDVLPISMQPAMRNVRSAIGVAVITSNLSRHPSAALPLLFLTTTRSSLHENLLDLLKVENKVSTVRVCLSLCTSIIMLLPTNITLRKSENLLCVERAFG